MHELIAAPFLGEHFVLRPGAASGIRVARAAYDDLASMPQGAACPRWLADAVRQAFGLNVAGRTLTSAVLVRPPTQLGYARASYEINLGCNWDCEHCYLGLKQFKGLEWQDRTRLLAAIRDAGVVYLQLTGGEPTIDRLFCQTYELAWQMGMMLHISTNASRLHDPRVLSLLERCPPYRITVSAYGATPPVYDALVRRPGAFRLYAKGMTAALGAGLPLRLNIVLTKTNAHERNAMIAMAEQQELPYTVYSNLSPTIYGGGEVLPAQAETHLRARKPFTGCNAGHTFFHVDPHGRASICKVGRDDQISLLDEGTAGLARMGEIADKLLLRTGGCSGCALSGSCTVCRPLARLYQQARAPLNYYCQHGRSQDS